jgi:phage-related protein
MSKPSNLERPVVWIGSAKRDLMSFPEAVMREMGYALSLAQLGGLHPRAKPWKGLGSGVFEVVEDYNADTYRAVYTVRFKAVIYVLHAFQKKSPKGIKTAQRDIDLIELRFKQALRDHEEHYG